MLDVLVAGAGPAGAVAALILARAGARVLLVDRDAFPRDKLCGDTLSPGAARALASVGLTGGPLATARRLAGMCVTGPRTSVSTRYANGATALAITRRDLDAWLLAEAVRAGARFEPGFTIRRALVEESGGLTMVRGLVLSARAKGRELRLPAMLTIGADGRRSVVARSVRLVAPDAAPRRWAFGVYASGVDGLTDLGEMHIRSRRYIGIAPVADGLANVCVVTGPRPEGRTPLDVVRRAVGREPALRARFSTAAFHERVRVLGPLAVDVPRAGAFGLLLAGDAAGFVDPMTGDGMYFAIAGAVLAAHEALAALERGDFAGAADRLTRARHALFGRKMRFDRLLRRLVDLPLAVGCADLGARALPGLVRQAICYAGGAQ